jgi:uncharacterized protein (TIGR02118 family)
MVRLSVMYPNGAGAVFDFSYFREKHMALVREHMGPHGLVRIDIERGLGGFREGEEAPYLCIASLYFETEGRCRAAMAAAGAVRADISKFTNVAPIRQVGEVLD